MEAFKSLSPTKRLLVILALGLGAGLILATNWLFYKFIGFFTGSSLSILILCLTYYMSLRRLVIMLAFPGTTLLMKKSIENDYCNSMAQGLLR
jgi:hypothetical protein